MIPGGWDTGGAGTPGPPAAGLGVDCSGSQWTGVQRTRRCCRSPQPGLCVCIRGKVAEHAAVAGGVHPCLLQQRPAGDVLLYGVGFTDRGPGLAHTNKSLSHPERLAAPPGRRSRGLPSPRGFSMAVLI